jgi:hypothetical protein
VKNVTRRALATAPAVRSVWRELAERDARDGVAPVGDQDAEILPGTRRDPVADVEQRLLSGQCAELVDGVGQARERAARVGLELCGIGIGQRLELVVAALGVEDPAHGLDGAPPLDLAAERAAVRLLETAQQRFELAGGVPAGDRVRRREDHQGVVGVDHAGQELAQLLDRPRARRRP